MGRYSPIVVLSLIVLAMTIPLRSALAADAADQATGEPPVDVRCTLTMKPLELRLGDPFLIEVAITNLSKEALYVYYPVVFAAKAITITTDGGDTIKGGVTIKGQETVLYDWGSGGEACFRRIEPGGTFTGEIKGRTEYEFVPAVHLPMKRPRQILLKTHDIAHSLPAPGTFTMRLHLAADERTAETGKGFGLGPVWTGQLDSNPVAFSLRTMTRAELDGFIAQLKEGTLEQRQETIEVLAANADRNAVPALMAVLNERPRGLIRPAAAALGAIQDFSIVPDLLAIYKESVATGDEREAEFQSVLLGTISALTSERETLADLYVEVLHSGATIEAKNTAIWNLAFLKSDKRVPALVEAATQGEQRVRWAAIDTLGTVASNIAGADKKSVTEPLVKLMAEDPDSKIRGRAASALAQSGDPSVAPALLKALDDPDEFVGSYAANGLGRLAGPEAIPALETFLARAKAEGVIQQARNAIRTIRQRAEQAATAQGNVHP